MPAALALPLMVTSITKFLGCLSSSEPQARHSKVAHSVPLLRSSGPCGCHSQFPPSETSQRADEAASPATECCTARNNEIADQDRRRENSFWLLHRVDSCQLL